jgi:hypothetical protein
LCGGAQVKITAILDASGMEQQTAWCDEEAPAGVQQAPEDEEEATPTITAGETPLADFVRLGSCLYVPVTNLRSATLQHDGPQHEVDGGELPGCEKANRVHAALPMVKGC